MSSRNCELEVDDNMKVIGFYSYKGGTGKSLAAANFAVCLSRLGIDCVLVDGDVEGPSLHNKYPRVGKGALGKGGFIGLMASYFKEEDWRKDDLENLAPVLGRDVSKYVYQLPAPANPRLRPVNERQGTIHLLPGGDIHGRDYWRVVWSPLWGRLFTAYSLAEERDALQSEWYRTVFTLLLDIRRGLAALEPRPKYMIVDFRTGASELSGTIINAWVDTLVYMFAFNEDSIDYLATTFGKIWRAGDDGGRRRLRHKRAPFDIVLALSRVPTALEYRGDRALAGVLITGSIEH